MSSGLTGDHRQDPARVPRRPLVSVVTPAYNAASKLVDTIEHVQQQTYPAVEHIVIDGGSGDGTVDVLKRYGTSLAAWVSEEDAGIYDAMNKGIAAARGEWVHFLGTDDRFYRPDTLERVFERRPIPKEVDVILGDVQDERGTRRRSRYGAWLLLKNTVHHQGAFYRRRVFTNFRYGWQERGERVQLCAISGDYQLNLYLWRQGRRALRLEEIIAVCGSGLSKQGHWQGYLEEIRIRRQHMGFFPALLLDGLTLGRFAWKQVRLAAGLLRAERS